MMATDAPRGEDAGAGTQVRECAPCRGTGRVISNLGGSPQAVPCPWCEGTGRFIPGHDAQAGKRSDATA